MPQVKAVDGGLLGSTADFERLAFATLEMMEDTWHPQSASVHYMHVIAGSLWSAANQQLGLFDDDHQPPAALAEVKRQINDKIGRFALRTGATLALADVYSDPANAYDICDIHGKMCFCKAI